jgi:hypothetical protein
MLCLIAGTLAQSAMGLYGAQKLFFASFVIWAGPVPLPGGYSLLGALTLCLAFKFIFHSRWRWEKIGIIFSHLGVLVLLIGGLFTALSAREGYMLIPEGERTPYVYDYHQRALYIFKNDILRHEILRPQWERDLSAFALPFSITIEALCDNCAIEEAPADPERRGMAQHMALTPKPLEKDPEAHITGLTLRLQGSEADGVYVAFEGMPEPIIVGAYKLIVGKQQRRLPFSLELRDFVRETYVGTDKARAYHSDVVVIDEGGQWPVRIEMNEPLRYRGYTFFQSSFEQSAGQEATILSVVENKGRLFPYIGTGILALGLLLHVGLTMRLRRAQQ